VCLVWCVNLHSCRLNPSCPHLLVHAYLSIPTSTQMPSTLYPELNPAQLTFRLSICTAVPPVAPASGDAAAGDAHPGLIKADIFRVGLLRSGAQYL